MATSHAAPRAKDEDRRAEMWGLALLWLAPLVGFLLSMLGLGY